MNEIDRAIIDFTALTGKEPTAIYLGLLEYNHLRNALRRFAESIFKSKLPDCELTYNGIKVYCVTNTSYIGVGIDAK